MKTYQVLALLLLALPSLVFAQRNPDEIYPEIRNFHPVDSRSLQSAKVLRGSSPVNQVELLAQHKVNKVLIFRSTSEETLQNELTQLLKIGIEEGSTFSVPFPWKDIKDFPSECRKTVSALNWIRQQVRYGNKVYIHCTAGEDRTGLLSALYRLWTEHRTANTLYRYEMCAKNYGDANRDKPFEVAYLIHESLTPLYFAMAEQMQKLRGMETHHLPYEICDQLHIKPSDRYKRWCTHR